MGALKMKLRVTILIASILFCITGIISFGMMTSTKKSGIERVRTYDELMQWIDQQDVTVVNPFDMKTEEIEENLKPQQEYHIKNVAGEAGILHYEWQAYVVEVGEEFEQYAGTYRQNAYVETTIQGDILEGAQIDIITKLGFGFPEKDSFWSLYGNGIMRKGERYLVFCEKSPLSKDLKRPQLISLNAMFSKLNLSQANTSVEYNDSADIKDVVTSEFIVTNPKLFLYLKETKEKIIELHMTE